MPRVAEQKQSITGHVLDKSGETHLLFSCAGCKIPKQCEIGFYPYCSEKCRKTKK